MLIPTTRRAMTLLLLALTATSTATADWVMIEDSPIATPKQAAGELPAVSNTVERQLLQIDSLIEAKAYDEALTALEAILADNETGFQRQDDGRHLSLHDLVHLRIAKSPPEMLDIYRGRVDSIADSLFDEAVSERTEAPLRRIVRDYFNSTRGDDALLRLGELALERGDIDAARRWWLKMSPELTDPGGRAWGHVASADQIAEQPDLLDELRSKAKANASLYYPDSEIVGADILARLATASTRVGQFARAETELALLKVWYPTATGRIAGRDANYVEAIGDMLTAAKEWSGSKRSTSFEHPLGRLDGSSVATKIGPLRGVASDTFSKQTTRDRSAGKMTTPVVTGHQVVFSQGGELRAVDLVTGRPAVAESGVLYREATARDPSDTFPDPRAMQRAALQGGRLNLQFGARVIINGRVIVNQPFGGMGDILGEFAASSSNIDARVSLNNSIAYALLGQRAAREDDPTPRLARQRLRLLGLDLSRQGFIAWEADTLDDATFSGPPVPVGDVVIVPIRDESGSLSVAAYDAASAELDWKTKISEADPSALLLRTRETDWLRASGTAIYVDSGDGFVVALDRATGEPLWNFAYDVAPSDRPNSKQQPGRVMSGALLVADGLVIVAPTNAPSLYALDAATGALVWQNETAWDVDNLLGVVDGRLIASGLRLWSLDSRTGEANWTWPESIGAGITGQGRGCIAGDEIFWPTNDKIYVFDIDSRQQTRTPLELKSTVAGQGALVVPAGDYLLISTPLGISAVGPDPNVEPKPNVLQ